MGIKLFQTGWNYSQDGPGNRLILHFQGCNFACPWCSNPEGCSFGGELFVRPALLVREACPRGAIGDGTLDREICRTCEGRECLLGNRNRGILFTAREYGTGELVRMARDSRPLFFDGGGVTLTGGEATGQFPGLKSLLEELGREGIHRALETNGSHGDLAELFPHTDLLIFDLKHWDFAAARPVIGNPGVHVLDNLEKAAAREGETLFRLTLIPGFNNRPGDREEFARIFASLPGRDRFRLEILTYHDYGREKWQAIGREYGGPVGSIGDEEKRDWQDLFRARGIRVVST